MVTLSNSQQKSTWTSVAEGPGAPDPSDKEAGSRTRKPAKPTSNPNYPQFSGLYLLIKG